VLSRIPSDQHSMSNTVFIYPDGTLFKSECIWWTQLPEKVVSQGSTDVRN